MARWNGIVGFVTTKETTPGVWTEEKVERTYYGDLLRNSRRLQTSDQVNDNINISNQISMIADPYAFENFHWIRYVMFMGTKWKVTDIEVQYPRLTLTLGGIYNGN